MAINFTTLTASKATAGSIANWVNRSDLPTENILLEAEALIYETLRVREMQTRDNAFTFASGSQTEALPSGFLDPISFRPYEWGYPLPFVHEDTLDEVRDSSGVLQSGTPSRWSIVGTDAYVDVLPSADLGGVLLYYKTPAALSVSNETNWLTVRYPSLIRAACMAKAYEHMKDNKANEQLQLAASLIAAASTSNEMWRRNQHMPA